MKDEFCDERGIAYRINKFESDRKTLVFVHGLAAASSAWRPFEIALENDFNILTYDLRGHGLSRKYKLTAEYELTHFADDLQKLLNYVGIRSCSLVSSSMGALIALSYLHHYSGIAKENLFIAPSYKQHSLTGPATENALLRLAGVLSWLPFAPRYKRLDYSQFKRSFDLDPKRLLPEVNNLSLRLYLICLAHVFAFTHDEWWSQIGIPSTIIHGTKDSFVPYCLAVELSKTIPNAKLVTVNEANHMLVINNKEEVISHIKALNRRLI